MRDALVRIGKRFISDIKRDDVPGLGAELAYRFLFAVFPFGIFVAALTAFVAPAIGITDPTAKILGALGDNLPADIAKVIRPQLEAVIGTTQPGLLTIGAVVALWAATGGTNALIKAMNRAYEVEETRPFIPRTALAVGLTLLASVGLLGAFVTIVGASLLTSQAAEQLHLDPGVVGAIGLLRWPVVFAGLSLAVGVLYKLSPNFRAPWRWSFVGGAIFSLGWLIATAGFGLYVANFANYSNTYGALGGVVVLMLWFYLSSMILVGAAAIVAAVLKEMQPHTVAAGQEAGGVAAKNGDAAQPDSKGALIPGHPLDGTTGAAAATASSAAGPLRFGLTTTVTAPTTARAPATGMGPTPATFPAARRRTTAGERQSASSILVSGAVIAAGVAAGTLAARLLAPDGS